MDDIIEFKEDEAIAIFIAKDLGSFRLAVKNEFINSSDELYEELNDNIIQSVEEVCGIVESTKFNYFRKSNIRRIK